MNLPTHSPAVTKYYLGKALTCSDLRDCILDHNCNSKINQWGNFLYISLNMIIVDITLTGTETNNMSVHFFLSRCTYPLHAHGHHRGFVDTSISSSASLRHILEVSLMVVYLPQDTPPQEVRAWKYSTVFKIRHHRRTQNQWWNWMKF